MKYKIGDIVRIRNDIEINVQYNGLTFFEEMTIYKNNIMTIKKVRPAQQQYEVEENLLVWGEDMLVHVKNFTNNVYIYKSEN